MNAEDIDGEVILEDKQTGGHLGISSLERQMLGMYIHLGWVYNHPYAARTWSLDDWDGYLGALHLLGYNMVLIWPMIENMPNPLTASDVTILEKMASVTNLAQVKHGMRVYFVSCPNVAVNDEVAARYSFEQRPHYIASTLVDPGDPVTFGRLMEWRTSLWQPLAKMNGMFVIDSDPGGYPHSTNLEFVYILGAHRRALDRLGPGIELYYWAHAGWEAYARYYTTGKFVAGKKTEIQETIQLLARQNPEPWGVASRVPDIGNTIGMADRVVRFSYGAIENEPSFPMTILDSGRIQKGAQTVGARGLMGNAQTHCVQLPNTFAFARVAQGQTIAQADYVRFANDLIPGLGETIVRAWEQLQGDDSAAMEHAARELAEAQNRHLAVGPLRGLLFGNPARYLNDLEMQLTMLAAFHRLDRAIGALPPRDPRLAPSLIAFLEAVERWQKQHGYTGIWRWKALQEALKKLDDRGIERVYAMLDPAEASGSSPRERIAHRNAQCETFTLHLLQALRSAASEMRELSEGGYQDPEICHMTGNAI